MVVEDFGRAVATIWRPVTLDVIEEDDTLFPDVVTAPDTVNIPLCAPFICPNMLPEGKVIRWLAET